MIAFSRILIPTNLGDPSKEAIRYGVGLARSFGARLFLLHVLRDKDYEAAVEAERVLEELVPDGATREPSADEVARTVARADLEQLLTQQEERDTRAEFILRPAGADGAHVAIVEFARESEIDLIVIGKHGLGRLEHMLGGSVTEKVLRLAQCPVLVVKHPGDKLMLQAERTQIIEA
jgi:universal stress protein A